MLGNGKRNGTVERGKRFGRGVLVACLPLLGLAGLFQGGGKWRVDSFGGIREAPGRVLPEGAGIRLVWEKAFDKVTDWKSLGGTRVEKEVALLYLLAKTLDLPKKPWVGDFLVWKERKGRGKKAVTRYRLCRVDNVSLEFFNFGGFLQDLKTNPMRACTVLGLPSSACFTRPPFADPNREKVFYLKYTLRAGGSFPSVEKALAALRSFGEPFPPPGTKAFRYWDREERWDASLPEIRERAVRLVGPHGEGLVPAKK